MMRLKHLLRMTYGDALSVDAREDGEVPVYGSNGIIGNHSKANTLGPAIIVGRKGSHGKVVWADSPGFCIDTAYYVDERTCTGDLRFSYFLLLSLGLDRNTRDTGVPGLERNEAHNKAVRVPDLPTQKRIAAFLGRETARIDELITKKERLVEVLDATHAAAPLRAMANGMGEIQYDPTNNRVGFSSLASGWQRVRVKQVAKHITSGSRGWSDFIQDEGELFLQSGNIDRKMGVSLEDAHRVAPQSGAEADRTTVRNGDTLVCITGGRTGAVGFVSGLDERAYINQHVCLIRPSKAIEDRLLAQILFSEIGQLHFQMAQYGLKQGMGFEQVANVAIPLPPRDQQASISAAIDAQASKTTKAASEILTSVERLREYRAAIITAAVTGQIDVETYSKTGTTSAMLDRIEEEMQA